jgi:hypothetical protein
MPLIKKTAKQGELPEGPFLALQTGETEWLPIPRGANFRIVEDIENDNKVFPMVLKSVRRDKIVFVVADTEYTFKLVSGKPLNKKALQRMQESRGKK